MIRICCLCTEFRSEASTSHSLHHFFIHTFHAFHRFLNNFHQNVTQWAFNWCFPFGRRTCQHKLKYKTESGKLLENFSCTFSTRSLVLVRHVLILAKNKMRNPHDFIAPAHAALFVRFPNYFLFVTKNHRHAIFFIVELFCLLTEKKWKNLIAAH